MKQDSCFSYYCTFDLSLGIRSIFLNELLLAEYSSYLAIFIKSATHSLYVLKGSKISEDNLIFVRSPLS